MMKKVYDYFHSKNMIQHLRRLKPAKWEQVRRMENSQQASIDNRFTDDSKTEKEKVLKYDGFLLFFRKVPVTLFFRINTEMAIKLNWSLSRHCKEP